MTRRGVIALESIQSGDLLAWKRNSHSDVSNLLIQSIRVLTKSPYGHVGIAWRCHDGIHDELFVIEATMPKIQVSRVMKDNDCDCVPMSVDWEVANKAFLVDKIGLPYSVTDAVRAYLGKQTIKDDRWQCVELASGFYEASNIKLEHDFTPGGIVKAAERYTGQHICRVV